MKKKDVKQNKSKGPIVTIPISKADIQAFESSKLLLEKDLTRIANLLAPYTDSINLFNERISEMFKPVISVADIYGDYFNSIRKIQEEMLAPTLRVSEMLKPILESSKVFESIALSQTSIAKQLQGLVINLPLEGYFKTISASASFELTLDKFTSIKSHPTDYLLSGTAIETTKHESIGIKVSSGFEMRLSTIESKVEASNSKLDYLIEKDTRRDELLNELVEYVKSTGTTLAKIQKVSYNHSSTEILINDIKVKVRGNTNQSSICKILLSSKKAMQSIWEMEDIREGLHEKDETKNWHRVIYDAVNELNTKILIESKGAVKDFFLVTMKTVTVNPQYIA